jgi:DNA-binding LytR/AlgR family response regulator
VDDEPLARQVLREEIELLPDLEVVGEAENGIAALEAITAARANLVFLDLQMPGMGGFEVIERLRGGASVPAIVVVTAFDRFAIRALDEGAMDYLLKPVSEARLQKAVDRARPLIASREAAADHLARLQEIGNRPAAAEPARPRKIVGRIGEEYFLLNAAEVLAFQADGEMVWIVTARQRYVATQSLRKIQEKLEGGSFRRIHRNALINVEHVRKLSALSSNRWLLTLNNNQEFVVSKRMAHNVREILSG